MSILTKRRQICRTIDNMDLKNAVVLITGGSSGIGRAAAQVLTQAGARVAILGVFGTDSDPFKRARIRLSSVLLFLLMPGNSFG
jgi:nucleoside-diphosphate-sugar epimerase